MKKLLVLLFLLLNASLLQAADYVEGKHYKRLSPQATSTGDKIEVLEFFWYGCPHCYTFEPFVAAWKKTKPANVVFIRVPAIFRPAWEIQARAYYALNNMGVIEDVHEKIFHAVEKYGVDRKKFMTQANSFAIDGMVRKAKKRQAGYKIEGVPSIAVNGKYLTSGSMSGSYDNLINIMDYLIEKESK